MIYIVTVKITHILLLVIRPSLLLPTVLHMIYLAVFTKSNRLQCHLVRNRNGAQTKSSLFEQLVVQ